MSLAISNEEREKRNSQPAERKRVRERHFMRAKDFARRELQSGKDEKKGRKPPGKMTEEEFPARQSRLIP
jgi:hypothetical protein